MEYRTREEYMAVKRRWQKFAILIKIATICEPTDEVPYWSTKYHLWNPLSWVIIFVALIVHAVVNARVCMKIAWFQIKKMLVNDYNAMIRLIRNGGRVR